MNTTGNSSISFKKHWPYLLVWLIILTGMVLRVGIYLQNRNLIIDESNVARNIFERGFVELMQPLYYEQYAPVLFLWITELFSLLFGFSEYALRLYPLLAGLASLFVFYKVLGKFMSTKALLFPLALFASAHMFLRYSSELKQYMPDVLITLTLIWLALSIDFKKIATKKFVLLWFIIGSVAIWSSMPSVFLLFGVGCYYGYRALRAKEYKQILPLILVSVLWAAQFAVYYYTILEPQANSEYLQKFHQYYFLHGWPANDWEREHNWQLFNDLMKQFEGELKYVHFINKILLFGGLIIMFLKDTSKAILLGMSFGALLLASALNQYSLIIRVVLFSIPILLIVVGYGFDRLLTLKWWPVQLLLLVVAGYSVWSNAKQSLDMPYQYEQLTTGLEYMEEQGIPPEAISLYHSSVPAWKYYTRIHPNKERWSIYKKSDTLHWSTQYNLLAHDMRYIWGIDKPVGFVFTNATQKETDERVGRVQWHLNLVKKKDTYPVKCFIFESPGTDSTLSPALQ